MADMSIWQLVTAILRVYVRPIQRAAAQGPQGIADLVKEATGGTDATVTSAINTMATAVASLGDFEPTANMSPADVRRFAGSVITAWDALNNKVSANLAQALLDYLTAQCIWNVSPGTYSVLAFLGVVDEERAPGQRLDWDKLEHLWKPRQLLPAEYGWGSATFNGAKLLRRVANITASLGEALPRAPLGSNVHAALNPGGTGNDPVPNALVVPIASRVTEQDASTVGFFVAPVSQGTPASGGLAVIPFGTATFTPGPIAPNWSLALSAAGASGYGVAFRPSGASLVKLDPAAGSAKVEATLSRAAPWRMELGAGFALSSESVGLKVDSELGQSFAATFLVKGLAIGVDTASSDGFVAKLLPGGGLNAKGDLGITWSAQDGLRFAGNVGLELGIPLHIALGPVMLQKLDLGVFLAAKPILTTDARLDISASLGPFDIVIEGVGVRGEFDLAKADRPADGAKLGPIRASVGFLAPRGGGLSLDTGTVTAGGFLRRDEVKGEYGGIVNVAFSDLAIIGQGLIKPSATDFSMVIIVSVIFPTPIQLSFGFTLSGVGGLIAVNRTINTEFLREGLKTGALESLLFPEDPVANAPSILNTMSSAFPDKRGRYVFGPIFRIGWGTPNLIVADIGIMIELPQPVRLVLIGQIAALLPKPDDPVLVLHLDVLGVLDFEAKQLAIDATIYNSKILTYKLYGDAALRWNWGNKPQFALSVGGFHPKYTPPPKFPSLRRLTLNLYDSDNLQLDCKMYQALTSNTVQFGARVELYASVSVASIEGDVGFDGLIQVSPFHFDIDMSGHVSAEAFHRTISSVKVNASVSGPTPWHVQGEASFHVLRWDPSVPFDKTWGRRDDASVPRSDPRTPLLEALALPDAWGAAFPRNERPVETLAPPEEANPPEDRTLIPVRINPAAELQVLQTVLPFEFRLERFGSARPKNYNNFTVSAVRLGGAVTQSDPVDGEFARAQYEAMSDGSKLSGHSFVALQAGREISPRVRTGAAAPAYDITYEQKITLADGTNPPEPAPTGNLSGRDLRVIMAKVAARRMRILPPGLKRVVGGDPKVKVNDPTFGVVDPVDLRAKAGTGAAMSYGAAKAAMGANPGSTMVPAFEARP